MADQFFQMTQRNTGNTAWDNLFPASKFETAGGTTTAITLTIPNLTDGVCKTFVAKSSNNSSATTVNGKYLYKPNTTTAPTLIGGKAYTVWYNASNDCFFIKASATGTVTPDKVLAGETYSTEDDTDLVGTMDLKSEDIKEGVNYGGVIGSLKPIPTILAGDNPIFNYYMPDIGRVSTNATSYSKILSVQNNIAGTYRIKFKMISYDGGTVYAKIYKNNQAIGTERSTTSGTGVIFTEDFTLNESDEIELYGYVTSYNNYCNIMDFSINISQAIFFKQL